MRPNSVDERNGRARRGLPAQASTIELEALWNAPIGLAVFDAELRFVRVNEALAALDGVPAPAHVGKTAREVPVAQHPELAAQLARVRDTTRAEDVEVSGHASHDPGVLRTWHVSCFPISAGDRVGVGMTVTDVTEHRRAPDVPQLASAEQLEAAAREREAEELVRAILESLDDGFCVIELILDASGQRAVDYRFVEVNSAFTGQSGLADAKGCTARQLVPNLDEFWYETYFRVALTGEAIRFERYDAALQRWFEVQAMPFGATEQRRVAIVFRDITERRAREERLRTSESTLRSIYDSTSFMIGVVELPDDDSDVFHVYNSPATERYMGLAPSSMAGASTRALGVSPTTIAKWIDQYRKSQREQRSVRFEYAELGPHGPRWLDSTVSCIGPAGPGRTRFSYITEDVTERKRAEQRQRDREIHLRLAMEASLALAFEWDIPANRVRRLESFEEALPVTEGEFDTLEGVTQVVHPDDRALFRANVDAALASDNGVFRSEHRIARPSGEVRWFFETGRVEFDSAHRPIRLLGISQDVTERHHADDERRRQAQLISLSHEPIMVWSRGAGIIEWNAGAEQLFGYTRDEALGRDVHDLLRTRHRVPLEQFLDELERTGEWTGELCHVAKDGREIIVDSRHQTIDVSGDRLILESNRDITERKRADDALKRSEAALRASISDLIAAENARLDSETRFRAIADTLPGLVFVQTPEGTTCS